LSLQECLADYTPVTVLSFSVIENQSMRHVNKVKLSP